MPIVLVHGNPETDAIWDGLREHLAGREVIALSPPGFGASVPEGFDATSDAYVRWLAGELEQISGPIDLVGHDWGGGHVMRVVLARPELVRSWTIDIAGCFHPDYIWHDLAQVWQTPGAGEAAVAQMVGAPTEARVQQFQSLGVSAEAAASMAGAANEEMGRCILALYRSAAQPKMAQWAADLSAARTRPGLVIIPTEDHYTGGEALARHTAERAGARVAVLEGLGHWWMCQDPKRGAEAIRSFVDSLNGGNGGREQVEGSR